jgi:hypothetical protein
MPNRTWKGGYALAAEVSQIDTAVFGGTWESNDVVSATLEDESGNTKTIDTVTGSTAVATLIATVVAALNASTDPHFAAITFAAASPNLTATADTAGKPFKLTWATTENGGGAADAQTLTTSTTTPNQGPYDYGCAGNWWEGVVPVASDKVTIAGSYDIKYGLNQSSVTLSGFAIAPDYTGQIGFNGAPLRIALNTDALVGGAGTYYLDLGASNVSVRLISDDYPRDTTLALSTDDVDRSNYPFTNLKGSNLATLYVEDGRLEVARNAGATSTVAAVQQSGGLVKLGSGTTLTTYSMADGEAVLECAATTVNVGGGHLRTIGTGAIATMTVSGGAVTPNSTGAISTLNVKLDGSVDFSDSRAARTVAAMNIYGRDAEVILDLNVVTVSASAGTPPSEAGGV